MSAPFTDSHKDPSIHVITRSLWAYSPVLPDARVRRVGDLLMVNQSVGILLHCGNVTYPSTDLSLVDQGLPLGK